MSEGEKTLMFEKEDWTVARRYVSWAAWIGSNILSEVLPLCLYQAIGSAAVSVELLLVSTSAIYSSSSHVHMCNTRQASAELCISMIKEVGLLISGKMEN